MRLFHVSAALAMVAGCQPSPDAEARLLASDWTNGAAPCRINHLSFRNGVVAYYPQGKPRLVMMMIDRMIVSAEDPDVVDLTVRPSEVVRKAIEANSWPGQDQPNRFLFRVKDGRLSLFARAGPGIFQRATPDSPAARVFDAIACDRGAR